MITWGIAAPVAIIGVVTLLDGVIPGLLGDVENNVAAKLQAGLNAEETSLSIGAARTAGTTVETLIADDGIYAFVNTDLSVPAPSLQVTPGTFETTGPDPNPAWHVSVYDPAPVTCQLSAPSPIGNPLDPTWRIAWTVVRTDANMTILSSDQLASTPGALTIEIDHASPGLMAADRFMVTCRLYRNLGYTWKRLSSSASTLTSTTTSTATILMCTGTRSCTGRRPGSHPAHTGRDSAAPVSIARPSLVAVK